MFELVIELTSKFSDYDVRMVVNSIPTYEECEAMASNVFLPLIKAKMITVNVLYSCLLMK